MTKRPREEDGEEVAAPVEEDKMDTKVELQNWLVGTLKNTENAVSSFVDLRDNGEEKEQIERGEQYRNWLTKVADDNPLPEGVGPVSELNPSECSELIKKCAMELVEDIPLVAGSFMFLDGSAHTSVNDWKDAELEKAKVASEVEKTHQDEQTEEKALNPRKRQKQKSLNTKVTMTALNESHVKSEASDEAETIMTVHKNDIIFCEEIKTIENDKWGTVRGGYVKVATGSEEHFILQQPSEYVLNVPKDHPEFGRLKQAFARLLAVYLRTSGPMALSKVGNIAYNTPFIPIVKFSGGVREIARTLPDLFKCTVQDQKHMADLECLPDGELPELGEPIDFEGLGELRKTSSVVKGKNPKKKHDKDKAQTQVQEQDQPQQGQVRKPQECYYFSSPSGCSKGDACGYQHSANRQVPQMQYQQAAINQLNSLAALTALQANPLLNLASLLPAVNNAVMDLQAANARNCPQGTQFGQVDDQGQAAVQQLLQQQRLRKQQQQRTQPAPPQPQPGFGQGSDAMQALLQSMAASQHTGSNGSWGRGGNRRQGGQRWNN